MWTLQRTDALRLQLLRGNSKDLAPSPFALWLGGNATLNLVKAHDALAQVDCLPHAERAEKEVAVSAIRLLLVEDDEDFREAAAAELKDLGFEVQCFADGTSFLEAFAAGTSADVIVLDWNLPTLTGIDLIP